MASQQRLRVVVKLGSNVVLDENGRFAKSRLTKLFARLHEWMKKSCDIIIVSSGAVGLGRGIMKNQKKLLKTEERQALASIGQSHLVMNYEDMFAKNHQTVAQVLLTREDLADRERYVKLKQT